MYQVSKLAEAILKFEEGFRSKPYLCSEGYVTIGYGQKIHTDKGQDPKKFLLTVSEHEAAKFLRTEIVELQADLESVFGGDYKKQTPDRKAVLVSMAYQLGINGLVNFKKMWKGLSIENFEMAHREALDSLWARQTPGRANRHALTLLTGKSQYV